MKIGPWTRREWVAVLAAAAMVWSIVAHRWHNADDPDLTLYDNQHKDAK